MYCLNPHCPQPSNPESNRFCQTCGTRLLLGDRYRAYQPLGTSGETLLGLDTHQLTDPRCIIKRLPAHHPEVLHQEIAQLATVSHHPQIPTLYAYFDRPPSTFLIQQFIEGQSLLQLLANQGTFHESQIIDLLRSLLPLLHHLHTHQLIHRNIQPSNLIVPPTPNLRPGFNSPLTPKSASICVPHPPTLVGFTATKLATPAALAAPGTVIGSAEYTAPEQLIGQATFTSDLYSLGVTCIHLLTGLRPFDLFDSNHGIWRWRSVAGVVSDRLANILDRMMATDLSDRYPSALAVLEDMGLTKEAQAAKTPKVQAHPKPKIDCEWVCRATLDAGAEVTAIAPFQNNHWLLTGDSAGQIKFWDLTQRKVLHTFAGHTRAITAMTILGDEGSGNSSDFDYILSSSRDCTIKIWQFQNAQLVRTLTGHTGDITGMLLLPASSSADRPTRLLSISEDKTLRLWNWQTGETLQRFTAHRAPLEAIALHPQFPLLATGDTSGSIYILHTTTWELLRTLPNHAARIGAIAFIPDVPTLVSSSWDMALQISNANTGERYVSLPGHQLPVTCIASSRDGGLLATGSHDTTIKLWDTVTGTLLQTLSGHTTAVEAIAFLPSPNPNEYHLVSASRDHTLRHWTTHQP